MVKIVVDSAADMPIEFREKYDIQVVPLKIIIDDKSYRDGIDMTSSEFFKRLKNENIMPSTSQPTVMEYKEVYEKILAEGHDVLVMTLPSAISGSYQSAVMAARELPEHRIEVLNMKTTSLGTTAIAVETAKVAATGASMDAVLAKARDLNDRVASYFIIGNLEMLKRGGRVSNAAAFLGQVLSIMPLLTFADTGEIKQVEKLRGWKKFYSKIRELYEKEAEKNGIVCIAHGDFPSGAEELEKLVKEIDKPKIIFRNELGPMLATHTGGDTLGLFFFKK